MKKTTLLSSLLFVCLSLIFASCSDNQLASRIADGMNETIDAELSINFQYRMIFKSGRAYVDGNDIVMELVYNEGYDVGSLTSSQKEAMKEQVSRSFINNLSRHDIDELVDAGISLIYILKDQHGHEIEAKVDFSNLTGFESEELVELDDVDYDYEEAVAEPAYDISYYTAELDKQVREMNLPAVKKSFYDSGIISNVNAVRKGKDIVLTITFSIDLSNLPSDTRQQMMSNFKTGFVQGAKSANDVAGETAFKALGTKLLIVYEDVNGNSYNQTIDMANL